jgi:hypothetical protein
MTVAIVFSMAALSFGLRVRVFTPQITYGSGEGGLLIPSTFSLEIDNPKRFRGPPRQRAPRRCATPGLSEASALVELTRAPVVLAHVERLAYAAVIATTSLA